jgi:hypothetical protein
MDAFPINALKPRHAILSGAPGRAAIAILMQPFLWQAEIVDTAIRLDGIELPSVHLADLAGRSFAFPVNPAQDAIDGSIYLGGAHHPVDVTALDFARARDGGLSVIVKGVYVFEFEVLANLRDTPFTFGAPVSSRAI